MFPFHSHSEVLETQLKLSCGTNEYIENHINVFGTVACSSVRNGSAIQLNVVTSKGRGGQMTLNYTLFLRTLFLTQYLYILQWRLEPNKSRLLHFSGPFSTCAANVLTPREPDCITLKQNWPESITHMQRCCNRAAENFLVNIHCYCFLFGVCPDLVLVVLKLSGLSCKIQLL